MRLPHSLIVHANAVSGTDLYGNELRDDVTDFPTPGRVDVASTGESLDDRNEQREVYDVILPGGLEVDGWDSLTWVDRGDDFVLKADGPFTPVWDAMRVHHLEGTAYRTRG